MNFKENTTNRMQSGYFHKFAAAFVRGKLKRYFASQPLPEFFTLPLEQLTEPQIEKLFGLGKEKGLQLHKFKRTAELPRVGKVLGILKGLCPSRVLDIGTGRGAFLWPMLHEFPNLPVICIDRVEQRVSDLQAMREGGLHRLAVAKMDAIQMAFQNNGFDVITILETLEHIPEPEKAIAETCRVATRFVVLSTPSKRDENPEHIHLFNAAILKDMLKKNGVKSIKFDYVLNHMITLGKL